MCGRFSNAQKRQAIERKLMLQLIHGGVKPRYNIAPSQDVLTARLEDNQRVGRFLKWGLIPHWAKPDFAKRPIVNARSETVKDKPSFRDAFRKRRCIIPADGYFEWKTEGRNKRPFYFTFKDHSLFCFAGLWDSWTDPGGNPVETFCMITTEPNPLCATVHDRMPVILRNKTEFQQWLNPQAEVESLVKMLQPIPDSDMQSYEVSKAVNKAIADTPDMIEPLPKDMFGQ